MTAFSASGGTSHSSSISGLTNGGNYSYYVKCQDAFGNTDGADYTISFSVAADSTAPSVSMTAPLNGATVSGSNVTLSATATDDVSVLGVQFKLGTNTAIGAEDTSSPYSVTWDSTGTSEGVHTLIAVARDGSGNYATSTAVNITVDNTGPIISSIASSTTGTTATITWTTNEASNSLVDYGTASGYGTASTSAALVTSHSVTITGLSSSTTYHFRVQSVDGAGNTTSSADKTLSATTYLSLITSNANLLSFWRMDESSGLTFTDSKAGHTAALNATGITLGSASSYIAGDSSTAATFDGTNGYASTSAAIPALDFTRTSPFSISAIIKPNVTRSGANANYWVYSKANTSGNLNGLTFGVRWASSHTGLMFQFGSTFPTQYLAAFGTTDLANGQAYLVTATYDGSGTSAGVKFYINGVLDTTSNPNTASESIAAGQDTTAPTFPAEFGRWGAIANKFKGDVKDLALFNTTLSPVFITSLFDIATQSAEYLNPLYAVNQSPRPQVFYDLDIDSDIDDVVDAVTLLNLEHRGELDIVGAVVTSANSSAAPTWLAIANYYGRASIPTGVNRSAPGNSTSLYTASIASTYGVSGKTTASQFEDSTTTQRRTLAAAANNSIEYITTGDLSSVKALLQSAPDGYSALTGAQLVAQKVCDIWIVAGNWPSGAAVSDFGSNSTLAGISNYVLTNWPTSVPMIFDSIPDGNTVLTGGNVMEALASSNPARAAWELYFGNTNVANTRAGWSQIAMLPLARGLWPRSITAVDYSHIAGYKGTASVDSSTGVTSWTSATNSNQSYLGKFLSDSAFAAAINALLLDPSVW